MVINRPCKQSLAYTVSCGLGLRADTSGQAPLQGRSKYNLHGVISTAGGDAAAVPMGWQQKRYHGGLTQA